MIRTMFTSSNISLLLFLTIHPTTLILHLTILLINLKLNILTTIHTNTTHHIININNLNLPPIIVWDITPIDQPIFSPSPQQIPNPSPIVNAISAPPSSNYSSPQQKMCHLVLPRDHNEFT